VRLVNWKKRKQVSTIEDIEILAPLLQSILLQISFHLAFCFFDQLMPFFGPLSVRVVIVAEEVDMLVLGKKKRFAFRAPSSHTEHPLGTCSGCSH